MEVTLSDPACSDADEHVLGKVMEASADARSAYSMEANDADPETADSDNLDRNGSAWFWYVAPDHFTRNSVCSGLDDSEARRRRVRAAIEVSYVNGSEETLTQDLTIVRPPLLLVHGLWGSPSSWDDFRWRNADGDEVYFTGYDHIWDDRFPVLPRAVRLDPTGAFEENAGKLLNTDSQNSIIDVIRGYREAGYAANQVDYVGHSMGGSVLRYATDKYEEDFYGARNYEEGYVNRFIALNTPHQGSPWANFVTAAAVVPNTNPDILSVFVESLQLLVGVDLWEWDEGEYKAVDALLDLRADEGESFGRTEIPSHLIAGDLLPETNLGDVSSQDELWNQPLLGSLPLNERSLRHLLDIYAYGYSEEVERLFELGGAEFLLRVTDFVGNLYGIDNFGAEGDLLVPLESQRSGLDGSENLNLVHTEVGISHSASWPLGEGVNESVTIGNHVKDLLNTPTTSGWFDHIPTTSTIFPSVAPAVAASSGAEGTQSAAQTAPEGTLEITAPTGGAEFTIDESVQIQLSLENSSDLSRVDVFFQDGVYSSTSESEEIEFDVQVGSSAIDEQTVLAVAKYETDDGPVFATDNIEVTVEPDASAEDLSTEALLYRLDPGDEVRPEYRAIFSTFATTVSGSSSFLFASVADPSVVSFDEEDNTFTAEGEGETSATLSYRGASHTIYFSVGPSGGDGAGAEATIEGTVSYHDGRTIEEATLELSGSDGAKSTTTSSDGTYELTAATGESYELEADGPAFGKDETPADYFNVMDLAIIRQHTLTSGGSLETPVEALAADLDGSEDVTPTDLQQGRALILGQRSFQQEQQEEGPWYCVAEAEATKEEVESYETAYSYDPLEEDQTEQDFTCFLKGDLGGSWAQSLEQSASASQSEGEPVRLAAEAEVQGNEILVPVRAKEGFTGVGGVQFTLEWDQEKLEYAGLEDFELEGLSTEHFNAERGEEGLLAVAWDHPKAQGQTLADGEALFVARFRAKGQAEGEAEVSFSSELAAQEAHRVKDGTFEAAALEGADGEIASLELPEEFALEGNYPNPFRQDTRVAFDLPAEAEVSLKVYDMLGREVLALPGEEMAAGAGKELQLSVPQLSAGVYFYRLRAEMKDGTETATGRLTVAR